MVLLSNTIELNTTQQIYVHIYSYQKGLHNYCNNYYIVITHFLEMLEETIVFYTIACEPVQLNNCYRRLTIVYIDYNSFL